jgi:phosphatidate cytidylyltransferase
MSVLDRDLLLRLSVILLIPPLLWVIFHPSFVGLALLVHVASAVGQGELYWMTLRDRPPALRMGGIVLGLALSVTIIWVGSATLLLALLAATTIGVTIVQLFWHRDVKVATADAGLMLLGALHVPLLLATVVLLKRFEHGSAWVILTLTVSWLSDTGAYFVGRTMGRHKLYPTVSPGKSVEGALGGVAAAVGAAVVAKVWYLPLLGWIDAVLIGIIGSVLGQLGDLVESMIKRGYGVKDSGRILPGHGGLLDRIDALLFVSPYVWFHATYLLVGV